MKLVISFVVIAIFSIALSNSTPNNKLSHDLAISDSLSFTVIAKRIHIDSLSENEAFKLYSEVYNVPEEIARIQYTQESTDGTSDVAKKYNNGFGHRYGVFDKKLRKTRYYYKKYKSVVHSIKAHYELLNKHYRPCTGDNDIDFWLFSLEGYNKRGEPYAEDPNYRVKLKILLKQLNTY
jgi:flagellum-specific peptidoglycan hydrolase FlgJ